MPKNIREDQICLRISRPLRAALEDEATIMGGCGLSAVVRKILVDHAAKRINERAAAPANQ
jgi:hypothetical protein